MNFKTGQPVLFCKNWRKIKNSHVVKLSATSSLIAKVPEVKLFGLAQTEILRIDTEEVVLGAH